MKAALIVALAAPAIRVSVPLAPPVLSSPAPLTAASLSLPAPALLPPSFGSPSIVPTPVAVAPVAAPAAPLALLAGMEQGALAAAAQGDAKPALDLSFDQRRAVPPSNPELVHAPAPSLFDKTAVAEGLASGRLTYAAELGSPNPVSAATLTRGGGIGALFVHAPSAERGQISALVAAVSRTAAVVIGRFDDENDPSLKPKLDEGLLGAVLENASSLRQTLRFLDRLYLPPLGKRSVGPSDVTGYLGSVKDFVARNNGVFLGGVSIGTGAGVAAARQIVLAKSRGLRFLEVDSAAIAASIGAIAGDAQHAAALAEVEDAARQAGVALVGRAASRSEALAMHARGYRLVSIASDAGAARDALDAYADVPREETREPKPVRGNAVAAWLRAGKVGALAFLMTPDLLLARRLAAGTDGLWIDAEDGQFPLSKIKSLVQAAAGKPAMVRSSAYDSPEIPAYLAAGAAGIIAPQVAGAKQARLFVETVKKASPGAAAIVMIESKEGLSRVEAIARTPGLDALFIGPYDLALSLGLSPDSAEFKAALKRIEDAARAAGVPLGGLSKSRSETYALHSRGYGLVATVSDQGALAAKIASTLGPAFAAAGY